MFDFFAEINFTNNNLKLVDDFFDQQEVYHKLPHQTYQTQFGQSKVVWISKSEDTNSVFENDRYFTLIYGYAFTRLDAQLKIGTKRLTAEEITQLHDEHRQKIMDYIKGSYSILIFDKKNESVCVFTDKFNIKNIYYSYSENQLLVSSSLSAFSHYSPEQFSKANIKSILEYYLFDFDLVDESFITGVKTLASATYIHSDSNGLKKDKYWSIFKSFANSEPIYNQFDGIKEIEKLLKENLKLYLGNPDKTAFALTGGYDSRTNLALLNGDVDQNFFYSYGLKNSYDVTLAKKVAKKLDLNFKAFIMDKNYAKSFDEDAEIAIALGDGASEMNRANYVYVYKDLFNTYDQILTGLFGSELIKRPTSLGGYIDKNVRDLLLTNNVDECYEQIIQKAKEENYFKPEIIDKYKEQILTDLKNNPFIVNKYEGARKFFFFITGVGNCKYFMKEIKTERPFVENLHPYLDIEFIELLMKTPYPWVYNWETKKSLLENLKIHKFYAYLIHRNNKKLSNIISTHAYKPKYLLRKIYLPFLIAQFVYYKRKIRKIGIFNNDKVIWDFYTKRKHIFKGYDSLFNQESIENEHLSHMKDFTRLSSLQIWMDKNKISV
jgi:asparagine synthetase B (glutamine-hydrolysing)